VTGPGFSARERSSSRRVYLRPTGFVYGDAASGLIGRGDALPLVGTRIAFSACEVTIRDDATTVRSTVGVRGLGRCGEGVLEQDLPAIRTRLAALSGGRGPIAGLGLERSRIVGVVNVTPDSFYDGGRHGTTTAAVDHARRLIDEGADIIDIGGESSRPGGATPLDPAAEADRVLPVVEALNGAGVPISVDTRHATVMSAAVASGAAIINDITGLAGDGSLSAAARARVPVVVMHCPPAFEAMHEPANYADVTLDVHDWLEGRIEACEEAGIPRSRIVVDPGIGFAKQARQSAEALGRVAALHGLGCAVLVGASRKSFIGRLAGGSTADERLAGSLAAAVWSQSVGVQLIRVHDVAETRQALSLAAAVADA
jgi:dihydropteroate synthase